MKNKIYTDTTVDDVTVDEKNGKPRLTVVMRDDSNRLIRSDFYFSEAAARYSIERITKLFDDFGTPLPPSLSGTNLEAIAADVYTMLEVNELTAVEITDTEKEAEAIASNFVYQPAVYINPRRINTRVQFSAKAAK